MADEKVRVVVEAKDQASGIFGGINLGLVGIGVAALGAAKIATEALGKIVDISKQVASAAIAAANEQEDADRKLSFALKSLGGDYKTAFVEAKEFAGSLQEVTAFGDETTEKVQALLVSLGRLEGETLNRATKATLDMSAALGIDLQASAKLVSQAATGMTSSLSRYGLVLDKNIPENEKFNAALELMERNFGGISEELAGTFQGRLSQIQNLFGDILEVVGDAIIKSPELISALEGVKEALTEVLALVKSTDLKAGFGELLIQFERVASGALTTGEILATALPLRFQGVGAAASALARVLKAELAEIVAPAKELKVLRQELSDLEKEFEKGITPGRLARYKELRKILGIDLPEAADALTESLVETNEELSLVEQHFQALRKEGEDPVFDAIFGNGVQLSGDLNANLEQTESQLAAFVGATDAFAESFRNATQLSGDLPATVRETNDEFGLQEEIVGEIGFGVNRISDELLAGALGAEVAYGEFFKQFFRDITRAIAKAILLKSINAATGGFFGFGAGGFVGAQTGGFVQGIANRDSVPALLTPGEVVVRKPVVDEVERRLVGEGLSRESPSEPSVNLNVTVAENFSTERVRILLDKLNELVEDQNFRVVASEVKV